MTEKLYTKKEAAEIFRCSTSTIDNWVTRGTLRKNKTTGKVLFPQSEIDRAIKKGMVGNE